MGRMPYETLEEFWYGNIEPTEYDTNACKEYKEVLHLITRNEEKLQATMTDEQKELFSYFLPVPGMEDQISQILLGVKSRLGNSVTSLTGNILIQGEEGSGKTVFATSLIKAIEKEVGNEDW